MSFDDSNSQRANDVELLMRALDGKLSPSTRKAFSGMLQAMGTWGFSQKQREWVKSAIDEPEYLNLASSGKAPRGKEVATPAVLQKLPLRPPAKCTP